MAQQLFTTTDGKTARLVNVFDSVREDGYSNPEYPIHSDKPIEGEFEGEFDYWYKSGDDTIWCKKETYDNLLKTMLHHNLPTDGELGIAVFPAVQPVPVKGEGKVEDRQSVGVYHVCHSCQVSGLRNCSEFDKCGNDKTYPAELRENTQRWYKSGFPLSVIAEKSFDMGHALASANMVEVGKVEKLIRDKVALNGQITDHELLIEAIKNLKQGKE